MPWVVWHNPTYGRDADTKWVDALAEPAPTVMAGGMFGCCRSHYAVIGPDAPDGPSGCSAQVPDVPAPPPGRARAVTEREYAIPSVAEIRAMAGSNGLVAASTFAGAGGSSTGYRWAGYDVRYANEYLDEAADSYKANWPTTHLDRRDVRTVTGKEILEACGVDELDLLDGSPPCQPFSMAGKRERNWDRTYKHGDGTVNAGGSEDLVYEWLRLVDEARPRVAVMENVKGLTVGKAKGYLVRLLADLRALGYRADAKLLDAQWLGTPQRRVRVYVVGVREDLGRAPLFPKPNRWRYTVADACPWLRGQTLDDTDGAGFDGGSRLIDADTGVSPTITATIPTDRVIPISRAKVERWRKGGGEWGTGPVPIQGVSPTIIAGDTDNNWPPSSPPRKFTILEVKRLSGFPDDYELLGSYADQWARLGNSVPPPLARAVGLGVLPILRR